MRSIFHIYCGPLVKSAGCCISTVRSCVKDLCVTEHLQDVKEVWYPPDQHTAYTLLLILPHYYFMCDVRGSPVFDLMPAL